MLSNMFFERVRRLIDVQFVERRKLVPAEITKIKRLHASKGLLKSGMTVTQITAICEREMEIRAVLIWQNLVRVIQTLGIEYSEDTAAELKYFFDDRINYCYDELTTLLNQSLIGIIENKLISLDEVRDHAIIKHDIEIDIYFDSHRKEIDKELTDEAQVSNYHFYGNVGGVQTGPAAQANIVQNLGQEDKEAIKQVLSLARDVIAVANEIAEGKRSELVEIVDEARKEIAKENPNNTKLQSLFLIIATTIQTIATATPAYQAIKTALTPLGILLP